MAKLKNERHERFCHEYIIDLNKTQAAIRAKYSEKTARQIGCKLLTKANIQDRIAELQKGTFKKLNLSAEDVLQKFIDIRDRCMQLEPVKEFVHGEWVDNGEYKFDASNALRANEDLGKHLQLFVEKIEHTGKVEHTVNTELIEEFLK